MKVIWINALLALSLVGCTVSDKNLFPHSDMTVSQVYEEQLSSGNSMNTMKMVNKRPATPTERNINPYINHNTPKPQFRMLLNPTMYLFVNTHLSTRDNIVVPAYITEFKLLKRDQYALPGESNLSNWN